VLENLLSNAIKFTSAEGYVQLRIEKALDFCSILIVDDGQGMDEKTVKRIQDKATIIPVQGTADETGHGLGLSLCHRFVDLHGGDMKIESAVGMGTTFLLRIPLR
jgi:signal transduction histidine kinase